VAERRCPACNASAPGRFCSRCGTSVATTAVRRGSLLAWWVAGGFTLIAILALAWPARPRPAPVAPHTPGAEGPPEGGTPPDLSSMTPRERFDRLYNRVMRAAESGDTAAVARFSPMAVMAYSQLDSVDADARYHAAVLQLHVSGDTAGALRLADSILATQPHHLFGYLIRGTAARLAGDQRLLARAYADFLAAWDAETRSSRPEYRDHQAMLDQFRSAAAAKNSPTP
jgi:hypothetical protein